MKPHLRSLRKDQEVWAVVVENIAQEEAIINFSGDLIRVRNMSDRKLKPGQRVLLQVQALAPLTLRLITRSRKSRSNFSLDVTA